jgi:hypothetical protein
LAPAIKWQISPIPDKFDLSITVGIGMPTGAVGVAGPGTQPYLQFPWSIELGSGWAITGMVTNFFVPADPVNRYTNQSTFVIERQFGERAFLFAEYVGGFQRPVETANCSTPVVAIESPTGSKSIFTLAS